MIRRRERGSLIFDVGFNIGQDSAFYLSQGHRVVGVEADPVLAQAGRERFAREIASGQLEILNAGIAAVEGVADFWICDDKPEFNSFFKEIAGRDGRSHHKIVIPTVRFESLLARYGTPHFLKIDIEGHDMLCLDDLDSRRLPAYLSIESECPVDSKNSSAGDGLRVLRRLRDLGFVGFKLIDQLHFNSLSLPPGLNQRLQTLCGRYLLQPPLNRIRGTYRLARFLMPKLRLERQFQREFPVGCSGAWGEDTAGTWLDFQAAEHAYRYYREQHFRNGNVNHYSFWCDWHAKS